jgi:hypothetical protein
VTAVPSPDRSVTQRPSGPSLTTGPQLPPLAGARGARIPALSDWGKAAGAGNLALAKEFHCRVLTLSGLQFIVAASVKRHARAAGVVRQEVEFPRLEGSFSPTRPMFVPVLGGVGR